MHRETWLVTGASRGIGLALVKELLRRGIDVIGACRNPEGERDLWEIKSDYKGRFELLQIDVTNGESVKKLAKALQGRRIDVLVNNAGVLKDGGKPLLELDAVAVKQSFDVNSIGPMIVTRELLPNLKLAPEAKIVNITSLMGSMADNSSGGYYGYRMSKAALNMFSVCLAKELTNMTVLALHPGWVKTDMGGPQAPTEVMESAEGLINVIQQATRKDSGRYLDFRGKELPW